MDCYTRYIKANQNVKGLFPFHSRGKIQFRDWAALSLGSTDKLSVQLAIVSMENTAVPCFLQKIVSRDEY